MKERLQHLWRELGRKFYLLTALTVIPLVAACVQAPASRTSPSALDFQGRGARIIGEEWWLQFALGTAVFVGVMGLLAFIIVRNARRPLDLSVDMREQRGGTGWIWIGGVVLPIAIISAVFALSIRSMVALEDSGEPEALTIEVIGHQWWWEVVYPQHGFRTANEVRVPVGEPVRIEVASNDVIHTFWVPQVHHKLDLIPGQTHSTTLQVNSPGAYRGVCAEFCGLQHARMQFMLVAMPPERFDQWLEREAQPAREPQDELASRGQRVFLDTTCVYCHQVRGTPASGEVGPDLTHVASRLTLGAGLLDNRPGYMAGWIVDPQRLKPGVRMPPSNITGEDLQALLAYLNSLE